MSDDSDERERAEAEALARALEAGGNVGHDGDAGDDGAPEDALEAAALLRYGAHDGELRPERAEAVLAGLLPRVDAAGGMHAHGGLAATGRAANAPRRSVRFGPAAIGVLAATALVSIAVMAALQEDTRSAPVAAAPAPTATAPASPPAAPQAPASALPLPPQRLLAAQAALAVDQPARDPAAFEAEMQRYRERVMRALERVYPAQTGLLEPALRGRR